MIKNIKNKSIPITEELKLIRQQLIMLNEISKKLHMEVIGTQSDLLKFTERVETALLMHQHAVDEHAKIVMTKYDRQNLINRLDTLAKKMDVTTKN